MRLIDGKSVLESFILAKEYVSEKSDENIQVFEEIWQSRDIQIDLGIEPILID